MLAHDTIAAISTPAGTGGIAIVRLSGPDSRAIIQQLLPRFPADAQPFRLYLSLVHDPATSRPVDEVLAVWMRAGCSYTREEMAEIHCHGGRQASAAILSLVLARGARLAAPGEFTRRALLNGRLDLVQAEAVADLIRAGSEQALQVAAAQLAGGLSRRLEGLEERLTRQLAALEAEIDVLAEEGLPGDRQLAAAELAALGRELEQLAASYREGRQLAAGLRLVIVGRPNVGKSSLLNALLDRPRAIVTAVPGTTRDVVSDRLEIGGLAVELADTAGIREPRDPVEKLGVAATDQWLQQADLVLLVVDRSRPLEDEDRRLARRLASRRHLVVLNKADLPAAVPTNSLVEELGGTGQVVEVCSRRDRVDIRALKREIAAMIDRDLRQLAGDQVVCRLRQRQLLERAAAGIGQALALLAVPEPCLDMVAAELQQARLALLEITGKRLDTDLLDTLFADFCVGK